MISGLRDRKYLENLTLNFELKNSEFLNVFPPKMLFLENMNWFNLLIAFLSAFLSTAAMSADKFNVCWSHYTGWEPWQYAQDSGILKKWADKNGINIDNLR